MRFARFVTYQNVYQPQPIWTPQANGGSAMARPRYASKDEEAECRCITQHTGRNYDVNEWQSCSV